MRRRRAIVLALAFATMLPAGWGFWIEPSSLRNETRDIQLPAWPSTCDGLRIAVLADLHTGSPWNGLGKLEAIVDLAAHARPDLILLAGDYVIHGVVGGSFVPPEQVAAALGRLRAPLGVYAVLGNHDWWFDGPRVRRALESASITVLEDAAAPVQRGECAFWLAGVSDYWEGAHDVARALGGVPAGATVLAFTHNPDVFPDVPSRVALTIAGHTHGGQVYLPGIGRPVVPSEYGERYAIGHVVEEGRHLFVSSGLGTSILPVRFLVPPEVSVVVLRSRASSVTRDDVLECDDARAAAMVAADVPTLEKLLDGTLTYAHSNGRVDSKETLMAALAAGRVDYRTIVPGQRQVRIWQGAAVVTGPVRIEVIAGPKTHEIEGVYTAFYRRDRTGCRLAAYHSSPRG